MQKNQASKERFAHRKLDIYHKASAFYLATWRFAQAHRFPDYFMRSQFLRAALSGKLNIAEGAEELSPKEKARFYRIARRSIAECVSMMDDFPEILGVSEAELEPLYALGLEVRHTLRQLCLSMEKKARSPSRQPRKRS